jgi:hypothetical protein
LGWEVDDIEATVAELRACGVVFEEYDLRGLKTVNGIAEVSAITHVAAVSAKRPRGSETAKETAGHRPGDAMSARDEVRLWH